MSGAGGRISLCITRRARMPKFLPQCANRMQR